MEMEQSTNANQSQEDASMQDKSSSENVANAAETVDVDKTLYVNFFFI